MDICIKLVTEPALHQDHGQVLWPLNTEDLLPRMHRMEDLNKAKDKRHRSQ